MVRLVPAVLLLLFASEPADAQSGSSAESWRFREVEFANNPSIQLPAADIGTNGRLGLGIFGFKAESARQRAVTVREVDTPRYRRAGVGFSLKF